MSARKNQPRPAATPAPRRPPLRQTGGAPPQAAAVQQKPRQPAAPPVYRPQPTPRVLQPKAASAAPPPREVTKRTPATPPPRPQPTPPVIQQKAASKQQPPACQTKRAAAAPPAHRPPTPKVLQAKPARPAAAATPARAKGPTAPARPPAVAPRVVQPKVPAGRPAPPVPQTPAVIQRMSVVKNPTWSKTKEYYKAHREVSTQQVDFGAGPEDTFVCNACNRRLPRVLATVDHIYPKSALLQRVARGNFDAPGNLDWTKVSVVGGGGAMRRERIPREDYLKEEFLEKRVHLDLDNLQLMCTSCNSRKRNKIENNM